MTVSHEQIQATLTEHSEAIARHENRFVVHESAMAHHDTTWFAIKAVLPAHSLMINYG